MIKRGIKKVGAILLATGLTIGMCSPSVSATAKIHKVAQEKATKNIQPEEWNREEIIAYQFDTDEDMAKYLVTGGLHYYNKNYKAKDHWVKIKVPDSGILVTSAISESKTKILLYDVTKKKVLNKDLNGNEYTAIVKGGEEYYVKLPAKIGRICILAAVQKGEFTSMSADHEYYEIGKGTNTYHPFSISKRSEASFDISNVHKKKGNISAYVEKNVNGKWKKVGNTATIKPTTSGTELVYGLSAGKYRLILKNPKDQVISVEYDRETVKKKVAYEKSKAKKIDDDVENIYTQEEQAARWYKLSVSSTKYQSSICVSKDSVGDGFKFTVYKKGTKKAIKTVSVKKNDKLSEIKLPKRKATYYIKVSKLTKKTNGTYYIEEDIE